MKQLRIAAKQAAKSEFKYRLGAVLEKGGAVLATGYNVVGKSTSRFFHRWESIHAEQAAILKVLKRRNGLSLLRGSTLYVTRIDKSGNYALARPCKMCRELISSVGIKRVVYSISNDVQGEL